RPAIETLIHPEEVETIATRLDAVRKGGRGKPPIEFRLIGKTGGPRENAVVWVEGAGVPIEFDGSPTIFVNARDITERREAEGQIRASLKEKEVLLKEVHHRVKNNLQVISSLLSLQTRHLNDASSRQMLEESKGRVLSIALVHEKLYGAKDLAHIDFADYVRSLAEEVAHTYAGLSRKISVHTDIS